MYRVWAVYFCIYLCGACFASQVQQFPNYAADNGESSYIKQLTTKVEGGKLFLRFEGELLLGRKINITQRSSGQVCSHVDTRLIAKLNNENIENFVVTVGPDKNGVNIVISPETVSFTVDSNSVELAIPLEVIKFSPIEVSAEMDSSWYLDKTMLFRNGRNLFSSADGKPVTIRCEELGVKPDLPKIAELQTEAATANSARLKWSTNNYTDAQIQLKAAGQETRKINYEFRSKLHQTTIAGLIPDTNYTVEVSGTDIAGRKSSAANIAFRTKNAVQSNEKEEDSWLSVKGKYIVDSHGNPFPLGGYSHYVGEYWHNEFPRYGTLALAARYFRSMGFNACRLGLVEHKDWWAASIMREGSAFDRYGSEEGYVKEFLKPLVDQVADQGVYVIIDWHWSYDMDANDIKRIGNFWAACAKEFKDEPRVAMYQLLNEPSFADLGGTRPELAPRLREIVKDYIQKIRSYDKRHIILVPDWNSGWGTATESQWASTNFAPGDESRQIVYSKHISREHLTDAFMKVAVDQVADKWDVPVFFDEVENSTLMSTRDTGWFYNFLKNNPRKYGFLIWVCGQYPQDFTRTGAAFSQYYLPVPPFGVRGPNPVIDWWRLSEPESEKRNDKIFYRFKLPQVFAAGDYGIVFEGAPIGTSIGVAVVTEKNKLIGTHLGVPDCTRWTKNEKDPLYSPHKISDGQSAVQALYWHSLEPFTEIIVRTDKEIGSWNEIQVIQLNPKHQMALPAVKNRSVEYDSE